MTPDPLAAQVHALIAQWRSDADSALYNARAFIANATEDGGGWTALIRKQPHPLQRHPLDLGWNVVVGNRGELPHVVIACCETLAEVQLIYATLQQLNGAVHVE